MNKSVIRIFCALMLAVVFLPAFAHAQHVPTMKATIPFDFSFAGKTYPAGEYSLTEPVRHFVVLRDSNNKPLAGRFTQSVEMYGQASAAKLRFYTDGEQHILAEIWQEGDSIGQFLVPTKTQVSVAKGPATAAGQLAQAGQQ